MEWERHNATSCSTSRGGVQFPHSMGHNRPSFPRKYWLYRQRRFVISPLSCLQARAAGCGCWQPSARSARQAASVLWLHSSWSGGAVKCCLLEANQAKNDHFLQKEDGFQYVCAKGCVCLRDADEGRKCQWCRTFGLCGHQTKFFRRAVHQTDWAREVAVSYLVLLPKCHWPGRWQGNQCVSASFSSLTHWNAPQTPYACPSHTVTPQYCHQTDRCHTLYG